MLLHELAIIRGCSLGELEARMGSREWTRWKAFYRIRPFGEAGADLRAGIVASAMANVFRSSPTAPLDFMPVARALQKVETEGPSPEELKAKALQFFKG